MGPEKSKLGKLANQDARHGTEERKVIITLVPMMSSPSSADKSTVASMISSDSLVSGYLYKKTRDGRWQKRWFETSGVYLTYYKSKQLDKLLAALSLPAVSGIRQVAVDNKEENPDGLDGLFALDLNARVYILRAKNDKEAVNWVGVLQQLQAQGAAAAAAAGGQGAGMGVATTNPMGLVHEASTGAIDPRRRESDSAAGGDDDKENVSERRALAPSPGKGATAATVLERRSEWVKSYRGRIVCC